MAKKNNPGCNCCTPTCAIFSDNFDRSNTSSMGSSWDERAGDWSISSNAAVCSIADGLMVTTQTQPDAEPSGYVSAIINCNTSNDVARLVIGYVDDNNFYFCQVRFTNTESYIQLGRKNAGTVSLYGFEATLFEGARNVDTLVRLCYADGVLTAQIFDGSIESAVYASVDQSVTITGTKVGIATGTRAGVIAFRSFDWQHRLSVSRPDCPSCAPACILCEDGTWPYAVQVEFDGVTNNGCANCNDFNTTVFISRSYNKVGNRSYGACLYHSAISICTYTVIETAICAAFLGLSKWATTILANSSTLQFDDGPACSAINFSVDCDEGFTHTVGSGAVQCDVTGATCTVTPIFA